MSEMKAELIGVYFNTRAKAKDLEEIGLADKNCKLNFKVGDDLASMFAPIPDVLEGIFRQPKTLTLKIRKALYARSMVTERYSRRFRDGWVAAAEAHAIAEAEAFRKAYGEEPTELHVKMWMTDGFRAASCEKLAEIARKHTLPYPEYRKKANLALHGVERHVYKLIPEDHLKGEKRVYGGAHRVGDVFLIRNAVLEQATTRKYDEFGGFKETPVSSMVDGKRVDQYNILPEDGGKIVLAYLGPKRDPMEVAANRSLFAEDMDARLAFMSTM
jgi:hypothetical protein